MIGNDNQMKIENEYMTVEFDKNDGREVIIRNKASGECCELSIMRGSFWVKTSNGNTEAYLEW